MRIKLSVSLLERLQIGAEHHTAPVDELGSGLICRVLLPLQQPRVELTYHGRHVVG